MDSLKFSIFLDPVQAVLEALLLKVLVEDLLLSKLRFLTSVASEQSPEGLLFRGLIAGLAAGRSLVWFGKVYTLFALYSPAVIAGLIPHNFLRRQQVGLRSLILGHGLVFSLIAVLLTQLNARSGFMFAAWGYCSFAASALVSDEEVEASDC